MFHRIKIANDQLFHSLLTIRQLRFCLCSMSQDSAVV